MSHTHSIRPPPAPEPGWPWYILMLQVMTAALAVTLPIKLVMVLFSNPSELLTWRTVTWVLAMGFCLATFVSLLVRSPAGRWLGLACIARPTVSGAPPLLAQGEEEAPPEPMRQ